VQRLVDRYGRNGASQAIWLIKLVQHAGALCSSTFPWRIPRCWRPWARWVLSRDKRPRRASPCELYPKTADKPYACCWANRECFGGYVVEVDRLLPGRGDVHDPRRRAVLDKRQQQQREQKPGEVIDRKAQLASLGTRRHWSPGRRTGSAGSSLANSAKPARAYWCMAAMPREALASSPRWDCRRCARSKVGWDWLIAWSRA
jgi:hypothetical protein